MSERNDWFQDRFLADFANAEASVADAPVRFEIRKIGRRRFLQWTGVAGGGLMLTFSNQPIPAEQALTWGLVNRVAPASKLAEQAMDWASELAHGSLPAMALAKRAFNKAMYPNLEQVLDYESHIQEIAAQTSEHHEGVSAFLEKRTPKFL